MRINGNRVAIIILNYNNAEDSIACIESILNSVEEYTIYLVDNNSTDNSLERIRNIIGNKCIYICSERNLGYAGGNNLGIKRAYNDGFEYICIANNDTVFEPDTINLLASYLEKHPNVGLIGPAILDYSNRNLVQSTGGMVNLYTGKTSNANSNKDYCSITANFLCPDYIGGACIVFKREVIQKIGCLPEAYFLFFEETEWCLKAKSQGFRVLCLPKAKIFHKGSATINTKPGLSEYLLERNRIRFVIRNGTVVNIITTIIMRSINALIKGIIIDKHYFMYLKYIKHGVFNIVDKNYSYIWLNNN